MTTKDGLTLDEMRAAAVRANTMNIIRKIEAANQGKGRKRRREAVKVIGETGPRNSMWFDDEMANTNPVLYGKRSEWRKIDGKWVEK